MGVLRWASEAVVHVVSLFRRKEWRRAGFVTGGGRGNDNRQNRLLGGKLGQVTPGHRLGMRTKYFHLLGETMHVTKLESWFD